MRCLYIMLKYKYRPLIILIISLTIILNIEKRKSQFCPKVPKNE